MSIVYENLAGADITKAVTVVPPSTPPTGDVNVIFLRNNVDSIFNLDVDGVRAIGRYIGVFMAGNKRCRVNVKSKNIYLHDVVVHDFNEDNYLYLDSENCYGWNTANPIYLSGDNGIIHISGHVRPFTHGQGIYSNAVGPVYVDDFLVEDATVALDVRAGCHMIANNVKLLKTHWVQGEGGSRAFGAFINMTGDPNLPARLDISNSQFYGVQGDGVHIHNGTLKYTKLTIQARDVPIQTNHPIDPKAIIDPTSSGLTIIPWEPIVIPGHVNFRTVSNLGVQLNGAVSVDGVLKGTAPLNFVDVTPGSHTARFGDIVGYASPLDQPFVVASGQILDIVGMYVGGITPVPKSPFWPLTFPAGLMAIAVGLPSGKKLKDKRKQRR